MKKLHLGCGKVIIPGYTNIDIQPSPGVDIKADLRKLPFEDGYADLIYSCANIEHFGRKEWVGSPNRSHPLSNRSHPLPSGGRRRE